jgi:hypothetical protein
MAGQGGNFKRTKHLICEESYIRERLHNNDMILLLILTKPVTTGTPKELSRFLCLE